MVGYSAVPCCGSGVSGTAENKRKCIKLDLNSKLEINLTYMVCRQNRGIGPNRGPGGSPTSLPPLPPLPPLLSLEGLK